MNPECGECGEKYDLKTNIGHSEECSSYGFKAVNETPVKIETDPINPSYYTETAVEPITAIEAWGLGFNLGTLVKYVARAGRKGGEQKRIEDLKKARWYLDREISRLTTENNNSPSEQQLEELDRIRADRMNAIRNPVGYRG